MLQKLKILVKESFINDDTRKQVMFNLLNIVIAIVAIVMTVMNVITEKNTLAIITFSFSILCIINTVLINIKFIHDLIVYILFTVEALALFSYFIISGTPEGFSVLWTLLVPSFTLAIFKTKRGVIFNTLTFLLIIFFFWLPMGRNLLQYEYSQTFMMRFPMVFICLFLIATYVEYIRMGTYKKLKELEAMQRYLSRHDPLTEIYNRYAFNSEFDKIIAFNEHKQLSMLLFDIDDFKKINDKYGHVAGDKVLKTLSNIITQTVCSHCKYCRWGGEEFIVLMNCNHDPYLIAESIRTKIEQTSIEYDGQTIMFTISIGLTTMDTTPASTISDFITKADAAMYISKTTGKNKTTVYKED